MKKMITLFLLVSLSYFSALATIDLRPNMLIPTSDNGMTLRIENGGSEDFDGTFLVGMTKGESDIEVRFSGQIGASECAYMQLPNQTDGQTIKVDSRNEVVEINENNNSVYFETRTPKVRLFSSWYGLVANGYRSDTLFVLPNEYFYEQFYLSDLSYKKSIIGIDFKAYFQGFSESQNFVFDVNSFWPATSGSGDFRNGRYSYQIGNWQTPVATSRWMANTSADAVEHFWIGSFRGVNKNREVGSIAEIDMSCGIVFDNLEEKYEGVRRIIKTIDRIRGDINDDGFVTEEDLDIIDNAVKEGKYNPCTSFKNMYVERGLNYGAGIILFDMPDFVSNILLHSWLHGDPSVQKYGIGELMSKKPATSSVQKIANSFSVVGNNLNIVAPEANLYNVTAQVGDKFFQATGEMGEEINLPAGATNIRVETVKIPQITTALRNILKEGKAEAYFSGNSLNIRATGKEKVSVINLSGQIMISTLLNSEESKIDASNWAKGMYLIKIGNKTTKVIK